MSCCHYYGVLLVICVAYLCVIDCGEGNTVLYTPERRSHEGVY